MKKILIIEDDKILRENTAEFLLEEEFDVYTACNGHEGIKAVFENFPDLILCDISMPEMDGYEVYRQLQADAAASLIPFIFLTARVENDDIRLGMGMGVDDYITKPFNIDELLNSINARIDRQEKHIRANEEKYRALTESSLTGVFMLYENKFEYTNDKFSIITGYPHDELMHMGFADLVIHDDEKPEIANNDYESIFANHSSIKELKIHHKSGEIRFIDLFARITPVNNRKVLIGNILDATERKKSFENILKAKEEAEIANRAKSEFLANVSHEIRTPLNGIIGMADLLKEMENNSEKKEYVDVIVSSANDLLKIINEILEISVIESGKIELAKKQFNFKESIKDIARIMHQKASLKDLQFMLSLNDNCPEEVYGDESKLRQILYNIVGNAIKFTEKGSVSLNVSCEENNQNTYSVSFSVEDTGSGIPENMHIRIFDAFIQADGSSTRKFGGTGLGLTIAKNLIEMMNGKINLKSEEKKGSTFYFTIQLNKHNN
jgi:PAS domain S-box-containing protein